MRGQYRDDDEARVVAPRMQAADTTRPRLLNRLSSALDEPWTLTIVSAPAGSGKTRLLTQWANELSMSGTASVAWVTMDASDLDLTTLRSGLLHIEEPNLSRRVAAVPTTLSNANAQQLAQALRGSARPVVVIVDDVHWISSRPLGRALAAFVRAIPANAHVVLAGRGMSAVPLARTRLTGIALEVTAGDLAFTADEVRSFFASRGVRITQGQLSAVLRRTEGWAAGLRLLELAEVDVADVDSMLRGDAPDVASYLLEELYEDLDEDLQRFLSLTAVPEEFTLDLARFLTGVPAAGRLVEQLAGQNVLLSRRGNNPRWYHYHPLLREFLLSRLLELAPGAAEDLQRVCDAWFRAEREYLPTLLAAAHDGNDAALEAVLLGCGLQLTLAGHAAEVIEMAGRMPVGVRASLSFRVLLATAEIVSRRRLSSGAVDAAGTAPYPAGGEGVHDSYFGIALNQGLRGGAVGEVLGRLDRCAAASSGDSELDIYLHLQASRSQMRLGRFDEADRWGRLAAGQARAAGLAAAELQALTVLAANALSRGRLREAIDLGDQAAALPAAGATAGRPYEGWRLLRAWALFETGRLTEARDALAASPAAAHVDPGDGIATGARAVRALLEAEAAPDSHAAAIAIAEHLMIPRDDSLTPHWVAMAAIPAVHLLNRLDEIELRDSVVEALDGNLMGAGEIAVLRAIAALHDGRVATARRALGPVLDGSVPCLLDATVIDAWLAQAVLEVLQGAPQGAQLSLDKALLLGAPEGHVRPFLDAGPVVARLLAARTTPTSRGSFAESIRGSLAAAGAPVDQELTEREVAVLRSLIHTTTLRTIAEREFISVNTVKTHVRNIYRKLGVSDREGAAAAATALGIE